MELVVAEEDKVMIQREILEEMVVLVLLLLERIIIKGLVLILY
jgi:hypothetical protein